MNKLIIGIIIGLIIGGMIGYFSYGIIDKPNLDTPRGNKFQVDEETKVKIVSFFESNSTDNEVEIYCQENRMYCMYYCTEINSDHEICSKIQVMDKGIKK